MRTNSVGRRCDSCCGCKALRSSCAPGSRPKAVRSLLERGWRGCSCSFPPAVTGIAWAVQPHMLRQRRGCWRPTSPNAPAASLHSRRRWRRGSCKGSSAAAAVQAPHLLASLGREGRVYGAADMEEKSSDSSLIHTRSPESRGAVQRGGAVLAVQAAARRWQSLVLRLPQHTHAPLHIPICWLRACNVGIGG